MRQFSRRGDRVTDFERTLIAECEEPQSPFHELAKRIGIDALVVVMDEFGNERISIPSRETFFAALYRKQRDADVMRRLANKEPAADIADSHGIHVNTVWHIRRHSR